MLNMNNSKREYHFKVHLYNDGNINKETRRFLTKKSCSNFTDIQQKLFTIFPVMQDKDFIIFWKDEDNDDIVIKTVDDWSLFLTYGRTKGPNDVREIYVSTGGSKIENKIHPGVECDSCGASSIIGRRYKCLVCEDFDLCSNCEKLNLHSQHCMVRIVEPELWNHWQSRLSQEFLQPIKQRKTRSSENF